MELNIIWKKDKYCNGKFLDYFEKIPKINFVTTKYDIKTSRKLENINDDLFHQSLQLLKIKPYLKNIIQQKINSLQNFNAVHIRRTDHIPLAYKNNKFKPLEEFEKFIQESNSIFLATDCPKTQKLLLHKYSHIKVYKRIKESKNLRKTSLEDSIIDLFICVNANKFMGTPFSSYSDLILSLRKNKN